MNYCHVTDGEVDAGPMPLPQSWRNVSGLDRASETELKSWGWFPVEDQTPEVDETKKLGPITLDIQDGKVVQAREVMDKTKDEIADEKIAALEATVTPERIRCAILTDDGKKWLAEVDGQIAALKGNAP